MKELIQDNDPFNPEFPHTGNAVIVEVALGDVRDLLTPEWEKCAEIMREW